MRNRSSLKGSPASAPASSPPVSVSASPILTPAGRRRCKRLRLGTRWPTEKVSPATETNAVDTNRTSQISMPASLNLEIDHAIDDEIRDDQRDPSVDQSRHEGRAAGQLGKVVLRKQPNGAIEDEGHGGEKPCRQSPFRAQRLDLELKRAALAHEGRKPGEHFGQIAASLALHADGGDEEQQIILADTTMQVHDGCRDVLTKRYFLSRHGEFDRDRVAHFLGGETNGAHERVADPQAAHDDVERVRQLSDEAIDPPSANDGQINDDTQRADDQTDADGHPQMGQKRRQRQSDPGAERRGPQSERGDGNSQTRLREELIEGHQSGMIEIGEPALLTKNVDGRDLGAAAGVRRQSPADRASVALGADDQPIESLNPEDDPSEHNPANNPEFAHRTHKVRAGSKQFDDTSMP